MRLFSFPNPGIRLPYPSLKGERFLMSRKTPIKAIIVGGGVAGLASALAFQRAGIEAVVYEAGDPPAGSKGSFLTLAMNGVNALRTLDAFEPVEQCGFWVSFMELVSGSSKRLGNLNEHAKGLFIERGQLAAALRTQAMRRGIRCETGKQVLNAHTTQDGVRADFADGTSVSGDLLVGADGIHSRVRTALDPQAPPPRYIGLLGFGGAAQLPGLKTLPETFTFAYGKRAFFGWTPSPGGEVYWFANIPSFQEPDRKTLAAISAEQWRQQLLHLFAEDATPATDLIRATREQDGFIPTILHMLTHLPHWYGTSMVLVGDAAHGTSPTSGQGASLAIEDSLILAKCLRDCSDIHQACAVYEWLRRPRVEKVATLAWTANQLKVASPLMRRLQDLVVPFVLKHLVRPEVENWVYQYQIDWEEKITPSL
jgi:2-polyprenyl-6-methoxyphenol hydroxylase-like FAD-dependent oxidoreductase